MFICGDFGDGWLLGLPHLYPNDIHWSPISIGIGGYTTPTLGENMHLPGIRGIPGDLGQVPRSAAAPGLGTLAHAGHGDAEPAGEWLARLQGQSAAADGRGWWRWGDVGIGGVDGICADGC